MKPVTIVLLTHGMGGAETRLCELWSYFIQKNIPARLIVTQSLFNQLRQKNHLRHLTSHSSIKVLRSSRFSGQCLELLVDAVKQPLGSVYHYPMTGLPLIHWILRQPVVISYTNTSFIPKYLDTWKFRVGFWISALTCSKIDVLNLDVAKQLQSYSLLKSKVSVTNGSFVDRSIFSYDPVKEPQMLYCGRFERDDAKGTLRLLHALPLIDQALAKAQFERHQMIFLGSGPLEAQMKEFLKTQNFKRLEVKIFHTTNPLPWMQKSKIIFSLQKLNNYPSRSLLEAMACGCLPIVTDVGETRKIATNDFAEFLPDGFQAEALAEKVMVTLSLDKKIKEEKIQKMLSFLDSNFSIENQAQYFLKVYKSEA